MVDYDDALGRALVANKMAYCRACGYRCHLVARRADATSHRHVAWDKLGLLLHLRGCQQALWVDADAVFTRPVHLPKLPTGMRHLFSHDANGLNSGIFLTRMDDVARRRLADVATHYYANDTRHWEQTALKRYFRAHGWRDVLVAEHMVTYAPGTWNPRAFRSRGGTRMRSPMCHAAGCPKRGSHGCARWLLDAAARWRSTLDGRACLPAWNASQLRTRPATRRDMRQAV